VRFIRSFEEVANMWAIPFLIGAGTVVAVQKYMTNANKSTGFELEELKRRIRQLEAEEKERLEKKPI
jgi:hypothetical protein